MDVPSLRELSERAVCAMVGSLRTVSTYDLIKLHAISRTHFPSSKLERVLSLIHI